jgi:hypothetical protein
MESTDLQTKHDQIRRAFASAIFAKASALAALSLTGHERARMRESIADDIRKACDLLASIEVSEAAHEESKRLGVDLRGKGWHDQLSFDPDRRIFHFEHTRTVAAIREAACDQPTVEGIVEVLRRDLRLAWILKSEDRELTRLGYRSKRPDPEDAYRAAGIKLRAE